jgi:hypothetical protein
MATLKLIHKIIPYIFGLLGVWLYYQYIYLELLNLSIFQIAICADELHSYTLVCPGDKTVSFVGLRVWFSIMIHTVPHVASFYAFFKLSQLLSSKLVRG